MKLFPHRDPGRAAGSHRTRRRMTLRGRLTVALLTLGIAGGVAQWWSARSPSPPAVGADRDPLAAQPGPAPIEFLRHLPASAAAVAALEPAFADADLQPGHRLQERVTAPADRPELAGPLSIDFSLDAYLTRRVFRVLKNARAKLGHVIVLDPHTGRVLAYASTDVESFPPTRAYPAASLVKVVTAAAALEHAPAEARRPCRYRGNPYRLTRARLEPPKRGRQASLEHALATSNNQCFAQLAVNALGGDALRGALAAFGWMQAPAPGHASGEVAVSEDPYALGRLGCGLDGCRITPLHAAQMAAVLADGRLVEPRWIDSVRDRRGRELALPPPRAPSRVLSAARAAELREMLVRTTRRGTARSAFRNRYGRYRLGEVDVAGKTGSLSGKDPDGRYEWFAGVAPADDPRIAVAVLEVNGALWWRSASQIAADVLAEVFCRGRRCSAAEASRFLGGADPQLADQTASGHEG
ncbi:MAG: hypothetical protein MJE66_08935 [Proteobacteria bacterium]|nr:hypothetical protein [Pseudomonadota bacterium]